MTDLLSNKLSLASGFSPASSRGLIGVCLLALVLLFSGCTLGVDLDNSSIEDRACSPGDCPSGQVCSSEGFCIPGGVDVVQDVVDDTPSDLPDDTEEDVTVDMPPAGIPDNRGDTPVLDTPDLGMCGQNVCAIGDTCCQCAGTVCEGANTCCFRLNVGLDCTDTNTDPENCGGCGTTCGVGETCDGGACACGSGPACGSGQYCCDGTCVDETTQCECSAQTPCNVGSCCGGVCVDTQTNPNHCNSCFTACTDEQQCEAGSCIP